MSARRRRTFVLGITAALLVLQAWWGLSGHPIALYNGALAAILAAVVVTAARFRPLNAVLRTALGALLLASVADRWGLFGGPGDPGVSWGSWSVFLDYLLTLLPASLGSTAPVLAVAATAAELAIGLALVIGWRPALVGIAAAVLLAAFGVAMVTAQQSAEMMAYCVPALVAGAALLGTVDSSWRGTRSAGAPAHDRRRDAARGVAGGAPGAAATTPTG